MRPTPESSDTDEFQSPSRLRDQTDYSLSYTNATRSRTGIVNPNQPSTSRAAAEAARKQQTSRITRGRNRNAQSQLQETSPKSRSNRNAHQSGRNTQTQESSLERHSNRNAQLQDSSPERRTRNNVNQRSTTTATTTTRNQQQQQRRRKQPNPLSAAQHMRREIQHLRNQKDFLIPKAPFGRLVREIMLECGSGETRKLMSSALQTLHEISEQYIEQVLADAYMLTLHRQRVTLMPKDIQLLRVMRLMN